MIFKILSEEVLKLLTDLRVTLAFIDALLPTFYFHSLLIVTNKPKAIPNENYYTALQGRPEGAIYLDYPLELASGHSCKFDVIYRCQKYALSSRFAAENCLLEIKSFIAVTAFYVICYCSWIYGIFYEMI